MASALKTGRVAIAAALLAAATSWSAVAADTKVNFAIVPTADSGPALVAAEEGYLAKRGIEGNFTLVTNSSTIPAAMMAGSFNVGIMPPSAYLQAVDSGLDIVVIAGSTIFDPKTVENYTMVGLPDSTIKTAKDYVGKTVSMPALNSGGHIMFRRWLMLNGVDPKDVKFVEIPFVNQMDTLRSKAVDVHLTVEPFTSRILGAGLGKILTYYQKDQPDSYGQLVNVWLAPRAWADKNKETVKAIQQALVEGRAFMDSNPGKTREYVSKYTKIPLEILNQIKLPVIDDKAKLAQMDFWVKVLNDQNMLRTKVDTSKLIWAAD